MIVKNFAPDQDVILIETLEGEIKIERLEDKSVQVWTRHIGGNWKKHTFLYAETHKPKRMSCPECV